MSQINTGRPRRYLMCRPAYFDVTYSINPWMDPDRPTSADRRAHDEVREFFGRPVVGLGLNAVSDGRNVILPRRATGPAAQLRDRGYTPIGVELSELLKAGGGVKCCTLELRSRPDTRKG